MAPPPTTDRTPASGLVRARAVRVGAYVALACWLTWPAVIGLGRTVPGAARTDLWNSLWSLWFVEHSLASGQLPLYTQLLDHPDGGRLLVSDPLNALLAAPLVATAGVAVAYSLLVLAHLAFSGLAAHALGASLARHLGMSGPKAASVGWVSGVAYASAPVLLSGVHNGTSEALVGGWVALAAWACLQVAVYGGARRVVVAGGALFLAALGSWYGAVCAFLFGGAWLLFGGPSTAGAEGRWRRTLVARVAAVLLGALLIAPMAAAVHHVATAEDNLVGIKHAREVASVRRTTGPADIVGFFAPGDYRSPDFREISRYGEEFFHCHYLGWVLLVGAGLALRRDRRRGTLALWVAGVAGAVLALGPVLARGGQAVILMGDRAIPLPYILVEGMPGLSSLSLLYRLTQATSLALAVLAGVGFASRARWVPALVIAAVLMEGRLASPLGALPDATNAVPASAIHVLADAPAGAVMNFPVVGGRGYLYEQTVHGKPLAGTLNFPNNIAGKRVWKAMLEAVDLPADEFRKVVEREARKRGIRYVVVHVDAMARPDMHDAAVRALKAAVDPLVPPGEAADAEVPVAGRTVRVYPLW